MNNVFEEKDTYKFPLRANFFAQIWSIAATYSARQRTNHGSFSKLTSLTVRTITI